LCCRFPALKTAVDYIQSVLQVEVTLATGQDYGSFAALNGVPLNMAFITNADITAGARRSYGQSCLTESNTLYEVRILRDCKSLCAVSSWHAMCC
jgi:hypothetical protein